MVRLRKLAECVEVPLRVIPRSKRDGLAGERNGCLCVRVTAAPVDGSANDAVVRLLAKVFGVPRSDVVIASGERSREKRVRLHGPTVEHVTGRLAEADVEAEAGD